MTPGKRTDKKEGGIDLKSNFARISGSELVGRDHIEGFSGKDVNQIIDTLLKYFPRGYLQNPDELDKTLSDFHRYHEQLHEYKELHNGINEILVAFEPFRAGINLADSIRCLPTVAGLRSNWGLVSTCVDSLLDWSKTIKYIGKPFQEFEDKSRSGERWAIEFSELQFRINNHLGLNEYPTQRINYPDKYKMFCYRWLKVEIPWWQMLIELTSSFSHASSIYMNSADKQLRQTAQELFNLSNKALSRYGMR